LFKKLASQRRRKLLRRRKNPFKKLASGHTDHSPLFVSGSSSGQKHTTSAQLDYPTILNFSNGKVEVEAGLPDFSWSKIYTKLPQTVPNCHKVCQMDVKYYKW
jgi:hypothetical protein